MLGQHFHQRARGQAVGHQRQTGQRHALACERRLHDLVGVVEIQPALGLQIWRAVFGEPAPPTEPLQLVSAVRVARLNESKACQVLRLFERAAALEQPGAGHDGELLAKQALPAGHQRAGRTVAQGDVHVGGIHIDCCVCGINADVNIGVQTLKRLQPRDQPHRGKRGPGGDGHAPAPRALSHQTNRAVNALHGGHAGTQQLRARTGELHGAGVAQKQGHTHFCFQRLNLAAHRALRES